MSRMRRVVRSLPVLAALVAVALGGFAAAPAEAKPSNKWRLVVDGSTKSGGTVVLRVTPVGGTAQDIETQIPVGTGENEVAKILTASVKTALGKGYHVERDDWEDVLIKRRGKTPDFEVTLVSSSIEGTSFKLKRE
ncbi:MAG: hypothetical protein ACKO9D_01415 [Gammaproteobacteria bacterium]